MQTLHGKNHSMSIISCRKGYGYKCLPYLFDETVKIKKKISFYCLNLPQTVKMIKNNKFSVLASLIILYLSLANARTFESTGLFDIPYLDKFVHFGLYFGFMAVIILEHRKYFDNTRKLILIALIPICFGSLMELLQSGITETRKGDIIDAMFNTSGVAVAVFLWLFIKPYYYKKVK
jgi:VanZ family protein